jgi:hypothetical protein
VLIPLSLDGFPYRITFLGRVHPPSIHISSNFIQTVNYYDKQGRFSAIFYPAIRQSRITIDCFFDHIFDNYESVLYMWAVNSLRPHIDLVCFRDGIGVIPLIERMIKLDGNLSLINHFHSVVASISTVVNDHQKFREVLQLAVGNKTFLLALNDLTQAISVPDLLVVNCTRSVEGIRQLIAGPGVRGDVAWPKMNDLLNLSESYTKYITRPSRSHRHAERDDISEEIQNEILRRSWTIMDRFINYVIVNKTKLDLGQFPLLF